MNYGSSTFRLLSHSRTRTVNNGHEIQIPHNVKRKIKKQLKPLRPGALGFIHFIHLPTKSEGRGGIRRDRLRKEERQHERLKVVVFLPGGHLGQDRRSRWTTEPLQNCP